MVAVALDGLWKAYGDTAAIDGVDLDVADGEFFTLVGPSGCGKTTTLRLVAGFEAPTAGTVRIGGADVTGVPPEDRDVGVVFQNYALFPHMSVGENVAYGLRFSDPPGGVTRDERVAELLDLVDLSGMADRDPDELSGGQQQRVALARALAPGPRLLLLDEPMSALDARLRERLRVQVKSIQEELGITTIYVTHDQEEALAISDRVAVLNDGRVEAVGPPRAVYRNPASRFAADFVGDNNVFDAEVVAGDAGEGTATLAVADATFEVEWTGSLGEGEQVALCVRPEYLDSAVETNRFSVAVESAEFLGETTRVHGRWRGRDVVLRLAGDTVPEGEVTVGFDPADAHVIRESESATRE